MNQLFQMVGNDQVILFRKGVYYRKELYERSNQLYAGNGRTFVGLLNNGDTSAPDTRWIHIDTDASFMPNALGRLQWETNPAPGKARMRAVS